MKVPKKLGLYSLTSLVTGNMIGSGIFLLPSELARIGGISLLSWIFTAAGALLLALVFSRMSNAIPKTGGPYIYVEHGFGKFMGFQTAYLYWIYTGVGNIAITIALIGYLRIFFLHLANPILGMTVATIILSFLVLINIWGVSKAGLLQLLTTIFKTLPLIAIAIFGWNYFNLEYITINFNVTSDSNISAFSHAANLTLWAFVGVESAAVPADSVDNPKRNVPLATLFGTIISTVLYIASSSVVMGMIPNVELAASTSPFAAAAKMIFGQWGEFIIAAGAIISCFGCLNGWILIQSQISMAIADDGLFPKIFAKRNRFNAPGWGLVINFILLCGTLWLTLDPDLVNQFKITTEIATTVCLFVYFSVGMSELIWLIKDDGLKSWDNKTHAAIALFASAYSLWAFFSPGQSIVYGVMILFMTGIALYAFSKLRKDSERNLQEKNRQ